MKIMVKMMMRSLNTSRALSHLMLRLVLEIPSPSQCSITGEPGQIEIDDAFRGLMTSIVFVLFVVMYDV